MNASLSTIDRAGNPVFRVAAIVLGGIVLLWIAMGVTLVTVAGVSENGSLVGIWPWGANPHIIRAAGVIGSDADRATLIRARQDAIAAVEREPASVQAVRTLALIDAQDNHLASANQLIDYAQTLSRRDLATEMYLIERFVQAGDINGALTHYDHALRTSRKSADVLMPVLTQAINEPSVRARLAELLLANPPWRYEFFSRVLTGASDLGVLEDFIQQAGLRTGEPGGATFTRQLLDRLIAARRYGEAFTAYRYATGGAALPLVRDGGFETANAIPPIEWWFSDDASLYAVREAVAGAGGRYALRIIAKDGGGGVAARQLLMLPVGHYRLTGRLGGAEAEAAKVDIRLACAAGGQPIATGTYTITGDVPRGFDVPMTIARNCAAQWLTFSTTASDLNESSFWVDDVAVRSSR